MKLTTKTDGADAQTKQQMLEAIDRARLPRHVAIIMDGNGRWAASKNLPRIAGHKKGMEIVHEIVTAASDVGVKCLTLYAFSLENWKRPKLEVDTLMTLLSFYLRKEIDRMMKDNIRFQTIGRIEDLPNEARNWIDKAKTTTASNTGMILNLALSYGGRWEILDAAKKFMADPVNTPDMLTEEAFGSCLNTAGMPELDLVIRTSGEMRISNFLLWQMAYAELYFTDALWPDFRERDLLAAILDYQGRQRRFGLTGEQIGR